MMSADSTPLSGGGGGFSYRPPRRGMSHYPIMHLKLTPRAFCLKGFSGWIWAKLAPIYSKRHLQHDSMPFFPLATRSVKGLTLTIPQLSNLFTVANSHQPSWWNQITLACNSNVLVWGIFFIFIRFLYFGDIVWKKKQKKNSYCTPIFSFQNCSAGCLEMWAGLSLSSDSPIALIFTLVTSLLLYGWIVSATVKFSLTSRAYQECSPVTGATCYGP